VEIGLLVLILPFGRHLEDFNTTELKWNLFSLVQTLLLIFRIIDEFKWGVRAPSRFAMRELKLTYLDKVETEVNNFI